mmetsp:Transcript_109499/g.251086  ORF Transcript_109499/g.251086 Transcript_109499/m.251086 type:complete len:241 (-) Transcript_109499:389-1111(-)
MKSFFDEKHLFSSYFPECERLIQEATGAKVARVFDYNVRSQGGKLAQKQIKGGGMQVQPPAHIVHNDYTQTSGPARLQQLGNKPTMNDVSRRMRGEAPLLTQEEVEMGLNKRFMIINVWRSIRPEPCEVYPLALASATTLAPEDLCVFEIRYSDRVGENYFSAPNPRHRWQYFPRMTPDEAILLKQWDSAGALGGGAGNTSTFSLHSAFADPTASPEAADRQSIETRLICIFDDAPPSKL